MQVFTAFFLMASLAFGAQVWADEDNCAKVLSLAAFKEKREAGQVDALFGRLRLLQMDGRYQDALLSAARQCYESEFPIPDVQVSQLLRLGFVNSFGRVLPGFCAAIEKDLEAVTAALEDYIRRHDPPTLEKFKSERLDANRFY